jgi:hypothetical protein
VSDGSPTFDVFVISRGTTFNPGASLAYVNAVQIYLNVGGNIVTEWSGANMFFSSYAADIRRPADNTPQLGTFQGAVHSGDSHAWDTPINIRNVVHPTVRGIANPHVEGGGTEFFFWIEGPDPKLEVVADFVGNGARGFPLGQDLPTLLAGCSGSSAFVFGTWDWNDTLGSGGGNDRFLLNAVNFAADPNSCVTVPGIGLEPEVDFNPVGAQHTLTATLTRGLEPVPDVEVTFEVFAGPNAGDGGIDTTDVNGEAPFAYTGDGGVGVDEIEAWFVDDRGETVVSNVVVKFWDEDCQRPPNGIPDTCDIDCHGLDGRCGDFAGCGGSADDDANGVPDECNRDPVCDEAAGDPDELWPPDHNFHDVSVVGVTDPDGDPVTITITGVAQDEPLEGLGDGNTCPDASGVGTSIASVRAERSGTKKAPGDGRVYTVSFTAHDGQSGECDGEVTVRVPHDQAQGSTCVDGGPIFDSTVCRQPAPVARSSGCGLGLELAFLLPPLVWFYERRKRNSA